MSIQDIFQSILEFKGESIKDLVQSEIDAGTDIAVILDQGLIAAMDEVGKRYNDGELFVPEMLLAGQTMKMGLEVLRPKMVGDIVKTRATVVIGTVRGDLHDIGKNLVAMMLEGAGFKIVDLGVDVPPDKFLEAAKENGAQLVAMSTLLTTTMPSMGETVKLVKESGVGAKTIVGGAPVNQAYADQIHADGYSSDAASAVDLVKSLVPA